MTLQQFITKWQGKKADWDNAYGGQCVDLFRYYCHEVLNIDQPKPVRGAGNFWTDFEKDIVLTKHFKKIPNSSDFKPIEGDVMIWNFNAGGGFGHVGICTGENTGLQYFKSFDQNWSRISYCEIVNHNYTNVYGVLRPVSSIGEPMPGKYTEEEMTKVREERDKNWNLYQDQKQETEQYKAIADTRKSEFEQYRIEVNTKLDLPLSSDPADTYGAIERLLEREDQYVKAEKKINQMEKEYELEKSSMKSEMSQLRLEIEKQQKQNEQLLQRVDELELRLQASERSNKLYQWLKGLFSKKG